MYTAQGERVGKRNGLHRLIVFTQLSLQKSNKFKKKLNVYLPLITTETYVAWQHTIKKYAFRSAARAAHYQMKLVKQQMSAPCK